MPPLPVTFLAYAKQLLAEYDVLLGADSRAFSRAVLKDFALSHPFNMSTLIHDARCGWEDAHLALIELIAEYTGTGRVLPQQLASYNIDILNPNLPPRSGGPNKANLLSRNILIVMVVKALVERFGLRAVKNRGARSPTWPPSASSIVDAALEAGGPSLGERRVEKVWETFRHIAFRLRAREGRHKEA